MGTLAQLKARIASDLTRDDLTTQIASVITDTIKFYARERFWFNQTRSLTFNTVASQIAYAAADLSTIPNLIRIDALYLPSTLSIYPLDRYEPDDFELIEAGGGGGKPTCYTYIDQTIRLWPTPSAIYSMRLHAFYKLPDLATDADTNAWTDDAEELVRSHAKMLLYMDVLEDDQNAQRMAAKVPALLAGLRSETASRMATGRIRGTDF